MKLVQIDTDDLVENISIFTLFLDTILIIHTRNDNGWTVVCFHQHYLATFMNNYFILLAGILGNR